jgi:hypothetical protein
LKRGHGDADARHWNFVAINDSAEEAGHILSGLLDCVFRLFI